MKKQNWLVVAGLIVMFIGSVVGGAVMTARNSTAAITPTTPRGDVDGIEETINNGHNPQPAVSTPSKTTNDAEGINTDDNDTRATVQRTALYTPTTPRGNVDGISVAQATSSASSNTGSASAQASSGAATSSTVRSDTPQVPVVRKLPRISREDKPVTRSSAQTSSSLKKPTRHQAPKSEPKPATCKFDKAFIAKLNTHGEWLHRHEQEIDQAKAKADYAAAHSEMVNTRVDLLEKDVVKLQASSATPMPIATAPAPEATATSAAPDATPTPVATAAPVPEGTVAPEDNRSWFQKIVDLLKQILGIQTEIRDHVRSIDNKLTPAPSATPIPTTTPAPVPTATPTPGATPTVPAADPTTPATAPPVAPAPGVTPTPAPTPNVQWDSSTTGVGSL